ncbi:MAG: hypothetical protein A2W99_17490 [Bacteroidetes bacterium GWF2_33_16]|nr:MAG: hypothetical protein A2W99_17490 [Bacteroidetes bacterium GWF2_33_16]
MIVFVFCKSNAFLCKPLFQKQRMKGKVNPNYINKKVKDNRYYPLLSIIISCKKLFLLSKLVRYS